MTWHDDGEFIGYAASRPKRRKARRAEAQSFGDWLDSLPTGTKIILAIGLILFLLASVHG